MFERMKHTLFAMIPTLYKKLIVRFERKVQKHLTTCFNWFILRTSMFNLDHHGSHNGPIIKRENIKRKNRVHIQKKNVIGPSAVNMNPFLTITITYNFFFNTFITHKAIPARCRIILSSTLFVTFTTFTFLCVSQLQLSF